jgi:hypothetical protein
MKFNYNCSTSEKTPLSETILENYDVKNQRLQIANYQIDLAVRKLKKCL